MAMDEEDMEEEGKDTLLPSTEEDIQRFSNILKKNFFTTLSKGQLGVMHRGRKKSF